MKLSRFFLAVFILTVTFCVYIQLHIQIFDLAYQGKNKESVIGRLQDDNGDINSRILKLKSSQHLGLKLLSDDSTWQFASEKQIVRMKAPPEYAPSAQALRIASAEGKPSIFSKMFSLKSLAEAGSTR